VKSLSQQLQYLASLKHCHSGGGFTACLENLTPWRALKILESGLGLGFVRVRVRDSMYPWTGVVVDHIVLELDTGETGEGTIHARSLVQD